MGDPPPRTRRSPRAGASGTSLTSGTASGLARWFGMLEIRHPKEHKWVRMWPHCESITGERCGFLNLSNRVFVKRYQNSCTQFLPTDVYHKVQYLDIPGPLEDQKMLWARRSAWKLGASLHPSIFVEATAVNLNTRYQQLWNMDKHF